MPIHGLKALLPGILVAALLAAVASVAIPANEPNKASTSDTSPHLDAHVDRQHSRHGARMGNAPAPGSVSRAGGNCNGGFPFPFPSNPFGSGFSNLCQSQLPSPSQASGPSSSPQQSKAPVPSPSTSGSPTVVASPTVRPSSTAAAAASQQASASPSASHLPSASVAPSPSASPKASVSAIPSKSPAASPTIPPVQFTQKTVLASGGSVFQPGRVTCVKVWGNAWYVGTLGGVLYKITVDASFTVTSVCSSPVLTDSRYLSPAGTPAQSDILGVVFDPSDNIGRPYVTVQTLFWHKQNRMAASNNAAWRNGRIVRLVPNGASSGQCLNFGQLVVDGLPVSDHDHANNGMIFDQNGDMLLSVGSFTNQGLPGSVMGSQWENPLSAAIVKIALSKGPSFNGKLTYSGDLPDLANITQLSGDVQVYASGLRTSFDLCFTSGFRIFATDNGPNVGFGNVATSCRDDTQDPQVIRTDSAGDILGVAGVAGYFRADKFVEIFQSKFYGHPNLNRGECDYIDPNTNKDPLGRAPPANYVAPLKILASSVNGIIEYTSSVFGNNLKGQLIVTSLEGGAGTAMASTVYRITPGGVSTVLDGTWGGLSVAQGIWGELIFPRINANNIHVLQPNYTFPSALTALVVTPFRGGAGGGLQVTVTGHNFGSSPTVTIGGNLCPVIPGSVAQTPLGSMLSCITPRASPGSQLVDVVVSAGGTTSTISNGFLYSLV